MLSYDSRMPRTWPSCIPGLSVALGLQYFSPLAALPGALFSAWHNIAGSLFAAYWNRSDVERDG